MGGRLGSNNKGLAKWHHIEYNKHPKKVKAMLKLLRNKKVAKKILIGLAAIIIPAFVLWGARSSGGRGQGPSFAGIIFGRKISIEEYSESWRAVKNRGIMTYGFEQFHKTYKQLDLEGQAWDRLILLREAKRQRIKASDQEVIEAIRSFPFLMINNKFDPSLYDRALSNVFRITPREFEEDMRASLIISKLANSMTEGIAVTGEELLEKYKEENEKIKIAYVTQSPRDFFEKAEISESEIGDYYRENSEQFKLPEQADIDYIEFRSSDYTTGIEITEDEISYYYDAHIDEFEHKESIHARHILLESEEEAKRILRKVKKRGADFAEMAKEHSTGPTKDKGGDLGYFERGRMVPEFEEAAFALKKGKISDIVKTQFGYHIIKLEDKKEPYKEELEDVKEKIKKIIISESAKGKAYDEAMLAVNSIKQSADFERVAAEYNKPVKTTGYFPRQGIIPNIGWNPEVQKAAFELRPGEIGPLISPDEVNSEASYIIRLREIKQPEVPPLAEVKDRVIMMVKRDKANEMAKGAMDGFGATIAEAMDSGLSFEKAAKSAGLEVKESEYITRADYIKDIGPAEDIKEAFTYAVGDTSPVITTQRVSCIVKLTDFKPIEEAKFEEEKGKFREKITDLKRSQSLEKWLTNLKLKANLQSNF